ncbi:MAG: hypothetical protein WC683_01130 [bacterium]
MARRNVAQYQVGQEVSVANRPGRWRIEGFPSRRLAIVCQAMEPGASRTVTTVSLQDLTILQPEGKPK